MPDQLPTPPGQLPIAPGATPGDAAEPRARSDYDQRLANELSTAATLLGSALAHADVQAALTYSLAELQEGVALQASTQSAFNARQQAVSTASEKIVARDALLETVREDFVAYRATVQANFPVGARTALGAGGRLPADLQKLFTLLRSAYSAGLLPTYEPTLAKRKLGQAVLEARLAQVDALEALDGQAKAADRGARAATEARDAAGAALRTWVGNFRKQAKADLRKAPDLLAKLGI